MLITVGDLDSPYRVLITGSQTWTDTHTIHRALDEQLDAHPTLAVVHGACPRGADAIADRWARQRGVPVERHPADWSVGRGAGPARNARMVATGPALCLAFILNRSPGASGCARMAVAAGIPTVIDGRER